MYSTDKGRKYEEQLSVEMLGYVEAGIMTRYYFDLKGSDSIRDHAGSECGGLHTAIAKGNALAQATLRKRPELAGADYYISVVDASGREIYQAPLREAVGTAAAGSR